MVDDQDKALKFYTEILGFVKKTEIPMGEHKRLTVVSKEELQARQLQKASVMLNKIKSEYRQFPSFLGTR